MAILSCVASRISAQFLLMTSISKYCLLKVLCVREKWVMGHLWRTLGPYFKRPTLHARGSRWNCVRNTGVYWTHSRISVQHMPAPPLKSRQQHRKKEWKTLGRVQGSQNIHCQLFLQHLANQEILLPNGVVGRCQEGFRIQNPKSPDFGHQEARFSKLQVNHWAIFWNLQLYRFYNPNVVFWYFKIEPLRYCKNRLTFQKFIWACVFPVFWL